MAPVGKDGPRRLHGCKFMHSKFIQSGLVVRRWRRRRILCTSVCLMDTRNRRQQGQLPGYRKTQWAHLTTTRDSENGPNHEKRSRNYGILVAAMRFRIIPVQTGIKPNQIRGCEGAAAIFFGATNWKTSIFKVVQSNIFRWRLAVNNSVGIRLVNPRLRSELRPAPGRLTLGWYSQLPARPGSTGKHQVQTNQIFTTELWWRETTERGNE